MEVITEHIVKEIPIFITSSIKEFVLNEPPPLFCTMQTSASHVNLNAMHVRYKKRKQKQLLCLCHHHMGQHKYTQTHTVCCVKGREGCREGADEWGSFPSYCPYPTRVHLVRTQDSWVRPQPSSKHSLILISITRTVLWLYLTEVLKSVSVVLLRQWASPGPSLDLHTHMIKKNTSHDARAGKKPLRWARLIHIIIMSR